jgi:hypothetical protein
LFEDGMAEFGKSLESRVLAGEALGGGAERGEALII